LKLIFLIVTRAVSLPGLSRREWWWKDAEILPAESHFRSPQDTECDRQCRCPWGCLWMRVLGRPRSGVAVLVGRVPGMVESWAVG
jgi:hypothetical protein